jgi:hypothetical protein
VKEKLDALVGADPDARSKAREALVPPARESSSFYLKTFADALNAQVIEPLKTGDPTVKLNVAIAVARVADRANNGSLAPAVKVMLKDPSDAIVLWGLKASQSVVPYLAAHKLDPNFDLIKDVAAVGQSRGATSKWLIDDAYPALTLSKADPATPTQDMAAMVGVVMPHVKNLLAQRVAAYAKGTPPSPAADAKATSFLVETRVWAKLKPDEQTAVVQLMTDLLNAATARFAQAPPAERTALTPLVKKVAGAFWVIGNHVGDQGIIAASNNVSAAASNPNALGGAVNSLGAALTSVSNFKTIKLTTAPTTQAASVAVQ